MKFQPEKVKIILLDSLPQNYVMFREQTKQARGLRLHSSSIARRENALHVFLL